MTSFIGDFPVKLDMKGRMVLPAAFKRQLAADAGEQFVVKKDIFEPCLVLYPMDEWKRQIQIIRAHVNPYNKRHNQFLRSFFRGTAELSLDANNRLLLPGRLLEQVGIEKEIVMAGQDHKIEIWPQARYNELVLDDDDFAGLAQDILGGAADELPSPQADD